jgi:hypothetical protein
VNAFVEGELVVVPPDGRLPPICVRCGARHDLTTTPSTFAHTTTSSAGGAIGGAIGAGTVAMGRQATVLYLVGAVVIVVVIAFLVRESANAPKVTLDLPLCGRCEMELGAVRRTWRAFGAAVIGLVVAALVLVLLKAFLVAGLAFAAMLGLTFYVNSRKFGEQFVRADRIDRGFVWLRGFGERARKRIDKAAKRAQKAAASDADVEPSFTPE